MKLNLGCGPTCFEGWTGVDLAGADVAHDLAVMPWPFPDNSAAEILASHVLEHFDRETGRAFLAECYRILQPGGVLHIAVPDMDKFITAHLTGNYAPLGGYHWTDLNHFMGGDDSERNLAQRHRYMYSWASLAYTLHLTGYRTFHKRGPLPIDNAAHAAFSLYASAIK